MRRLAIDPRPDWAKRVEQYGLHFHTLHGEPYWDESACYQLSRYEVDTLELATQTLHDMCLELVAEVIADRQMLRAFLVPPAFEDLVVRSWNDDHPTVYGRFDLAYDGVGPPKMMEYNADTPTALVEAAVAQWAWLKDVDERGDQFNSIHERLIEAWQGVREKSDAPVHFATHGDSMEDWITTEYMRDTCIQAGLKTAYLDIREIGWDRGRRLFVDTQGRPIARLFKLYPWEWLVREEFGQHVPHARTGWIEPAWKMILSSKSILPLLYDRHPDSPYLLPASFEPLPTGSYVRKPVHAREGANVQVVIDGRTAYETDGPYGEGPFVYQALAPLKPHDGRYPVLGSWVVNGVACGVGVREGDGLITTNTSRFVPHQMTD